MYVQSPKLKTRKGNFCKFLEKSSNMLSIYAQGKLCNILLPESLKYYFYENKNFISFLSPFKFIKN